MFKSMQDVHKAIQDFRAYRSRYPNVIFVSKNNKLDFLEMVFNSPFYNDKPIILQNIEEINIFGLQVKFTESLDGVDYMREFDKSGAWMFDDVYTESYYPELKSKKFILEKPKEIKKYDPVVKKKRKIIL